MAWINVTDVPPADWPTGNWLITWQPGTGWTWQRRDEDELQACFEDPEVSSLVRRFRAGLAKRAEKR